MTIDCYIVDDSVVVDAFKSILDSSYISVIASNQNYSQDEGRELAYYNNLTTSVGERQIGEHRNQFQFDFFAYKPAITGNIWENFPHSQYRPKPWIAEFAIQDTVHVRNLNYIVLDRTGNKLFQVDRSGLLVTERDGQEIVKNILGES